MGNVQSRVEDQVVVVPLVSQLEEGSVRIHSISKVRPEGHVFSSEDCISLNRGFSTPFVEGEEVEAHSCCK